MQIKQFEKILLTIDSHGEKGCCAATIIRETDIDPATVRSFLKKHHSLLTKKPSHKYTINTSGKHKGNIDSIVSSQLRTQRLNTVFLTITTALVIFSLGLSTRSIL